MIDENQYATLKKHAMRMNFSYEALFGSQDTCRPVYAKRSRFWLFQRRITNKVVFWMLAWAERKGFIENALCFECSGAPEATTDETYIARWEERA